MKRKRARIFFPENAERSGIDVTYNPKNAQLSIGGWYDSCAGMEATDISLQEFFSKLGITLNDCQKALREPEAVTQ